MVKLVSPVTGFYRYTDIVFEWHKALDQEHVGPLRAFLATTCLTHPSNPLYDQDAKGIEFTMGTLFNNESRLLFSSAQVEYIRYWIHAMGLAPELYSLPNSHYLITPDQLRVKAPVFYSTAADLKKSLKEITKNNKKVKDVDTDLADMRITFEKMRTIFAAKKGIWCAIDFEGWEGHHKDITEFGSSLVKWQDGKEVSEIRHLAVKNAPRNGNYIPDNRDWFLFGTTETLPKPAFKETVQNYIDELASTGPLFLVFHDYKSDLKYLDDMGFDSSRVNLVLPDTAPDSGIYCVDTVKLFSALEGEKQGKKLERIVRLLNIRDGERFHNAGNDAHYTLLALKSMASGSPLDVQREERWPTPPNVDGVGVPHAQRGVRRGERPEDDSDYEDTETFFRRNFQPVAKPASSS